METDSGGSKGSDVVSGVISTDPSVNPDYYKPLGAPDETLAKNKVEKILGYINVIGVIISVITLIIVGIKYMLGSIEDKAEYKKTMMYYIIGAALLFSATTLPNILYRCTISIVNN